MSHGPTTTETMSDPGICPGFPPEIELPPLGNLPGHRHVFDPRSTWAMRGALGARRAAATRDYLIARGVPANRLRTISFGKERPVAVCNDISCWSQNRRAVTLLTAPTG